MIDSHCHLDDPKFNENRQEIVMGFKEHNVDFVINHSCDLPTMEAGVRLANENERIFATIGMHPHTADQFDIPFVDRMFLHAANSKVVAVGEIGLDYHYDNCDRKIQRDVFAAQLEIADLMKLPVTLHIRDAYGDAVEILYAQRQFLNSGVLWHCYSGSAELARQIAKRGHYFSFGGAITFKNANKTEVLQQIPFEHILSETDSPYLSPEPLRGRVNTPFNVSLVVQKIAQLLGKDVETTEQQIRRNTLDFFPKIRKFYE